MQKKEKKKKLQSASGKLQHRKMKPVIWGKSKVQSEAAMVAPFDIYVCNTHHTTIYISCFSFFILDFCDKLYSDDLQFGYKYKSSTSVPGWLCRQFLSSSRNIHLSMLLRWTVATLLRSVYFLNYFVKSLTEGFHLPLFEVY